MPGQSIGVAPGSVLQQGKHRDDANSCTTGIAPGAEKGTEAMSLTVNVRDMTALTV